MNVHYSVNNFQVSEDAKYFRYIDLYLIGQNMLVPRKRDNH